VLDAIELLQAIGADASLRHASTDALVHFLDQKGACGTLRAAASCGDDKALYAALGQAPLHKPQITHAPYNDDEGDDDERPSLPPDQPPPPPARP